MPVGLVSDLYWISVGFLLDSSWTPCWKRAGFLSELYEILMGYMLGSNGMPVGILLGFLSDPLGVSYCIYVGFLWGLLSVHIEVCFMLFNDFGMNEKKSNGIPAGCLLDARWLPVEFLFWFMFGSYFIPAGLQYDSFRNPSRILLASC